MFKKETPLNAYKNKFLEKLYVIQLGNLNVAIYTTMIVLILKY